MSQTPKEKLNEIVNSIRDNAIDYLGAYDLEKAILAAVPMIVKMAREEVKTCKTEGGYSFNHHSHSKYKDAAAIVAALRGDNK